MNTGHTKYNHSCCALSRKVSRDEPLHRVADQHHQPWWRVPVRSPYQQRQVYVAAVVKSTTLSSLPVFGPPLGAWRRWDFQHAGVHYHSDGGSTSCRGSTSSSADKTLQFDTDMRSNLILLSSGKSQELVMGDGTPIQVDLGQVISWLTRGRHFWSIHFSYSGPPPLCALLHVCMCVGEQGVNRHSGWGAGDML